MSLTAIVIIILIAGVVCFIGWLCEPALAGQLADVESPTPLSDVPLDTEYKVNGPTKCPLCGEETLHERIGPYVDQIGQGTTTIEGVSFWNCSNCGYAYDNH